MHFVYFLFLALSPLHAPAQDSGSGDIRFQPPMPPPLNPATDFDDMDEDMMEIGDDGNFRPPPPPPIPQPPSGGADFSPPIGGMPMDGRSALGKDKVRFEIVPGEYYERGKKRGRGEKLRAGGAGSSGG